VRGGVQLNFEPYFTHFPTPPPANYCTVPKSPEEGRFDCPKYRENQLDRRFFFLHRSSRILIVVVPYRGFNACALDLSGVGEGGGSRHFEDGANIAQNAVFCGNG